MRMAMGSGSLLSSHGRGIGPQDASKKDCPIFLGLRQETLGSINLCRRSQGACQSASEKSGTLWVGGTSRDSSGFGAMPLLANHVNSEGTHGDPGMTRVIVTTASLDSQENRV